MKNKFGAALLSAAVTVGIVVPMLSAPVAIADSCVDSWSIVVGGAKVSWTTGTWEDSSYLAGDQRVGYETLNPFGGLVELDRLINEHRNECPDDHIKLLGHSEGAGIIHAWVTAHNGYGNISAVLLADPKRIAGPGGPGLSSSHFAPLIGYPLAGVDDWFGDIPVLEVCNHDDIVCNAEAGWYGYLFTGAHGRYNGDADTYSDWDSGVWFQ